MDSFVQVSEETEIPLKDLLALVQQVENGAAPAFLARYRADVCAGLDELQVHKILRKLRDRMDLVDRRISALALLGQRGFLTDSLKAQIDKAVSRHELNEILSPYRPRPGGAADAAIERGLDPLARAIWLQQDDVDIQAEARKHTDPERGVKDAEQAFSGAYAIAARWLSEKPEILRQLRELFRRHCELSVRTMPSARKDPRTQALDGYRAKAAAVPWQKRLSIRRGLRMRTLQISVDIPVEATAKYLERCLIKDAESEYAAHLKRVVSAAMRGGLPGRVKNEVLQQIDEKADSEAIEVFCKALRNALLAAPAHGLTIVGIETSRAGGWRAALIDGQGELLDHALIPVERNGAGPKAEAPAPSEKPKLGRPAPVSAEPEADGGGSAPDADAKKAEAETPPSASRDPEQAGPKPSARQAGLSEFLRDRDVDLIVYTDGPRRHTIERFVRSQIRRCGKPGIAWQAVRDARTWGYATSKAAKRELPGLDPAFRSAVTLARRVHDPMNELVKADLRTIKIGSNLYEVNPERLREALRLTAESTVHDIGVDANRASVALLALVPGLSVRLATRIVRHRRKHGPFERREDLLNVTGVDKRVYDLAVGFLRVHGNEPLDATGAHPDYRKLYERIAEAAGCDLGTLLAEPERLDKVEPELFATKDRSAVFVKAAIEEFRTRRRQVRGKFVVPAPAVPLRPDEELRPGSKVDGVVSSVSDFGVWVDIGGDKDALLHVSQIRKERVEDSKPALKPGEPIEVYIRPSHNGRIGLTMWEPRSRTPRNPRTSFGPGGRQPARGVGRGRKRGPGRFGSRKPLNRTFGPGTRSKGRRRPARKLTMAEKLDLLQHKYRTKI